MSRRTRLLASLLATAAAVAALAIFGLASSHTAKSGRTAPPLPSERLAGTAVTMPALLAGAHGHAVAVVFWASWCGPCTKEAPALERFSQGAGRGRIVGVDWSDGLSGARAFVRHFGWTFPNVRDSEGTVGNSYGLTGLPTTFVLDRDGRIRATLRGPQDEASLGRALARVEAS